MRTKEDIKKYHFEYRAKRKHLKKVYDAQYKSQPHVKERQWDQFLRKEYGITKEHYKVLLDSQDGKCAICLNPQVASRKNRLCVDHNHETKEVRGLLCDKCNQGLGYFDDNVVKLQGAINYLHEQSLPKLKLQEPLLTRLSPSTADHTRVSRAMYPVRIINSLSA